MTKKKTALLVLGCVFLVLVVLPELGVLDINVYQSKRTAAQSVSLSQIHPGGEKHFSYHLTIKYKGETVHSQTHTYNNLPPIEIEGTLEEPVYSGNDVWPLVKNFEMVYRGAFTTAKPPQGHTVEGTIKGKVTTEIYGFCSRRKARELAFEEAKKQMASYFKKQLNH